MIRCARTNCEWGGNGKRHEPDDTQRDSGAVTAGKDWQAEDRKTESARAQPMEGTRGATKPEWRRAQPVAVPEEPLAWAEG